MRIGRMTVLIIFIVAACGTPIPEATPTSRPLPTPELMELEVESIEVELLSEDPIILDGPEELPLRFLSPLTTVGQGIHAIAVQPVSIESNEFMGEFPTFFENSFYHVASPDGLEWAVALEPLSFDVQDEYDPEILTDSNDGEQLYQSWGFVYLEQLPDETWRTFLLRQPISQSNVGSLWSMTAPDISGPWTMSEGPLLTGDLGAWDEEGIWMASMLKVEDVYYFFYTTLSSSALGLAVSDDGAHWDKQLPYEYESPTTIGANTVFDLDPNQEWVFFPIWHSDTGWWMIYAPMISLGADEIYGPGDYRLAWSSEGIQWETTDVVFEYPETGATQSLGPLFQYSNQIQGCWYVSMSIGEGGDCYLARLIEHQSEEQIR